MEDEVRSKLGSYSSGSREVARQHPTSPQDHVSRKKCRMNSRSYQSEVTDGI